MSKTRDSLRATVVRAYARLHEECRKCYEAGLTTDGGKLALYVVDDDEFDHHDEFDVIPAAGPLTREQAAAAARAHAAGDDLVDAEDALCDAGHSASLVEYFEGGEAQ